MDKRIVYSEPADYFPPEAMKVFEENMEQTTIDDFKDWMTSPISAVQIDPETGEFI